MKMPLISLRILAGQKSNSFFLSILLFSFMLSGCAQTTKTFTWIKKAPENFAKNFPVSPKESKINNPAKLHATYAGWQEQLGKLTEARGSYEQALADNPKSVDAILGLARLDHLAGDEVAAEHGFKKALRIKPKDGHTLDTIGQFYASQKKYPQAIEMLNAAMAAEPKKTSYEYHLGIALARSGNVENAYTHLENTVGKPAAHYNIGYVLMENNQNMLAHDHFRQAIALNPEMVAAQTMLETVSKKLNQQQGNPVNPGLNNQSPMIASRKSPSIQRVSGNQNEPQWNTLTASDQNSQQQTIIPQSYQQQGQRRDSQRRDSQWAPAVYTPQYQNKGVNHAYSRPRNQPSIAHGNRPIQISPNQTRNSYGNQPQPSRPTQVPVQTVIPEQFPSAK